MAAPFYIGMTAIQQGNTEGGVFTIDCPLPSGITENDILYIGVSRNTKNTQSPPAPFSVIEEGWTEVININGASGRTDIACGVFLKRYASASQMSTVTIQDANTSTAGNDSPLLCFMAAFRGVDVVNAGFSGTGAGQSGRDWTVPFGATTTSAENLAIGWMIRAGSNTYGIASDGSVLSPFNVHYNSSGSFGGTNVYYGYYSGEKTVAGDCGTITYTRSGGGGSMTMFHIPIVLQPPQPLPPARTSLIT